MAFQCVSCTLSVFAHLLNIPAKENFGIFRERNFIFLTRYLLPPFPKILVDLLPKSTFPEKTRRNLQFSRTFPSESTHGHHNTPLHHQNRTLKESTSAFPLISTPIHNFEEVLLIQICLSDEAIISNVINIPEKFSSPFIPCANSYSNLKKKYQK